MARSKRWKPHAETIASWVAAKYASSGKELWDYVDGNPGSSFAEVGITSRSICEELITAVAGARKEGQADKDLASEIYSRIFNLFNSPGDPVRHIAEWPASVPLPPRRRDISSVLEPIPDILPEGVTARDPRRTFSDSMVREAVRRQGGKCQYCRRPFDRFCAPVGDHMLAHSLGGPTNQANCVAACKPCNKAKSDDNPVDFTMRVMNEQYGGRIRCI